MATSPRGYLLHSTQAAFGGPGLSHTLSEYLGGVALAHRFNMCLVYEPILCGHGLHDAFERLLWGVGDEYRGIPPPLCAPRVSFSADARSASMNGGKLMRVVEIAGKRPDSRDLSNDEIAARLATVPNGSLVVLRKVQGVVYVVDGAGFYSRYYDRAGPTGKYRARRRGRGRTDSGKASGSNAQAADRDPVLLHA